MKDSQTSVKVKNDGNFMVPTEKKSYVEIDSIIGLGIKPMNILEHPAVWSAVLRINTGSSIPAHKNTGLCELLVISGTGSYENGKEFTEGDYICEVSGQYPAITAKSELVVFLTNHGETTFLGPDEQVIWRANANEIRGIQKTYTQQ